MSPLHTRFAPSPTGALHLGHALAAITAHDLARRSGGRFLLRMEDIDRQRCRPEFEASILADLDWLGLRRDPPLLRQSERLPLYRARLDILRERGLVYPCFCTRGSVAAEIERMPAAPQGAEGPRYPGTCRALSPVERARRIAGGLACAWRLDSAAAVISLGGDALVFDERGRGPAGERGPIRVDAQLLDDVVLARKDLGVSYHLAVVVDDDAQGVTCVTRGEDLFAATHIQRLLQAVLGLAVPAYHHHPLVRDSTGRRLAKRDRDQSLAALRSAGVTPEGVRERLSAAGLLPLS